MEKKGQITAMAIVGIVIVVIVILGAIIIGTYNGLVNKDVSVQNQWGKVQSAYQRRLDLIPNLVATVKGSADFERNTQTQIATLRAGINAAKNPDDMRAVDTGTSSLLRNINIQVEAYPDLKSSANFRALQDELAGTENRVKWERDEYNNKVKDYQTATRTFPGNIFAGMFGFLSDKYKFFESTPGAENPPVVNFTG
jgi:LemA protein